MRSRLAALLGLALIGSGVTALGITLSAEAAGEGVRLYLRSASTGYAADLTADPSASIDGRAPAGSTLSPDSPTAITSDTATVRATANAPASGQPDTPSFKLPVTGTVSSVCLDVFASGPAGASISLIGYLSENNDSKTVALPELKVTPYPGGIVRLTGIVAPAAAFPITMNGNFGFFAGALNGPGSNVVLSYDSVQHPSNVTINPTSCTPVPVATPSGSASASASASTAPSASGSASASATRSATPTASPTTACPTTSPSATPTTAPTATVTPTSTASATSTSAPSATATATPSAAPTPSSSAPPTDGCNTPTRITLNVNVPQITAGNRPTLFGVVTDDLNKPVVGGRVDILAKGYGQTSYTTVATVVTDAEGRYSLRIAPIRQTAYGANTGSIRSRVIVVRVSTRVDIVRPAPGAVSNPVTFAGQLNPRFANVAVGLGYLTGGRFVVLTQTQTSATGSYSMTRSLPRGTFAFVVFTSAHQGTDKGSKSVRLTVR